MPADPSRIVSMEGHEVNDSSLVGRIETCSYSNPLTLSLRNRNRRPYRNGFLPFFRLPGTPFRLGVRGLGPFRFRGYRGRKGKG